ncbi:MAG: AMP-binding protein [Clostridia bacterium]|nr:AMP-binding protein [Clostridia bacterium]
MNRINNINGFPNITAYIKDKIARYEAVEKNYCNFFDFMFSERENVMAEIPDGYRIKKITYGECSDSIKAHAAAFEKALSGVQKSSIVGLYMNNGVEWIETLWCILMCGYRPLLMNSRMTDEMLERVLDDYSVTTVISDGKTFSANTLIAKSVMASADGGTYTPDVWGTEIIFMSSGTTDNVKLCAYTAENFLYQICDSLRIVEKCPQIVKGYEGEIKLLALLPFYHVFGFIAIYTWFGFFGRTFVFLKDIRPQTLLMTIQRHKVTHIFAVPLVWETVYKEAMRKIRAKGDKTYNKFIKALKIANNNALIGNALSKKAFAEIRENMFGDSICFLISGGSGIKPEILEFFNGIGYHMANGFGMTEVGITSVELSASRKIRNKGSIGNALRCTEYGVSENGELLVRGKTMASRIMQNGEESVTDFNEWFNTHDLVVCEGGRYYHRGRRDDLVICQNGENLNPEIIEKALYVKGINRLCLFADENGRPTLIVSIVDCFSSEKLRAYHKQILEKLRENHLNDEIQNIVLTSDKLIDKSDFKLSRKKVAKRYADGAYKIVDLKNTEAHIEYMLTELEGRIRDAFAESLQMNSDEIGVDEDFFADLGGSSLNYFALVDILKSQYGVELDITNETQLVTVKDFCKYIENKNK